MNMDALDVIAIKHAKNGLTIMINCPDPKCGETMSLGLRYNLQCMHSILCPRCLTTILTAILASEGTNLDSIRTIVMQSALKVLEEKDIGYSQQEFGKQDGQQKISGKVLIVACAWKRSSA